LLSCRILPADVAEGRACCRLAPLHGGGPRARRYPSDTTDAQWALIDPLLPDPAWLTGKGGRRESHCRRAIVDAIFYLVDNGTKWRALPVDFPPWSTVYNYFAAWEAAGITQDVLDGLRDRVRIAEGRTAAPSAAIIDSASVKAAETVGKPSRGYDAGKKINGRKRFIVTDTLGLLLTVMVCAASRQDRDGAKRSCWPPTSLRRCGSCSPMPGSPGVCSTGHGPSCARLWKWCASPPAGAGSR
jgi:transposase